MIGAKENFERLDSLLRGEKDTCFYLLFSSVWRALCEE